MRQELYELLERMGNLLRSEARYLGAEHGLHPTHIDILSYLNRCNQFSDTPAALKVFLGITKGTLSQSLSLLEKKGLILKNKDSQDKRVSHLGLTAEGQNLVSQLSPPERYMPILERFSEQSPELVIALRNMFSEMQQHHDKSSFGVCKTCIHHERRSDSTFYCKLTQLEMMSQYGELICKEHSSC